jgi:aspartyl protease family protein
MSRPIVWAFGLLASAGAAGLGLGDRLGALGFSTQPQAAIATDAAGDPVVVLSADLRGHYKVHPVVEGRTVPMLVDTGASAVALTYEDAERAGIRVRPEDFTKPVGTANGTVKAAPVRVAEMRVGAIALTFVDAMVLPRGSLGTSLLGMSFLKRLKGFEMAQGRLTLRG